MKKFYWHIATIVLILIFMYLIEALLEGIVNPALGYSLGAGFGYVISVSLMNAIKNRKKK